MAGTARFTVSALQDLGRAKSPADQRRRIDKGGSRDYPDAMGLGGAVDGVRDAAGSGIRPFGAVSAAFVEPLT